MWIEPSVQAENAAKVLCFTTKCRNGARNKHRLSTVLYNIRKEDTMVFGVFRLAARYVVGPYMQHFLVMEVGSEGSKFRSLSKMTGAVAPGKQRVITLWLWNP